LGNWGEDKASKLLNGAGFYSVRNLNSAKANHPFADIFAERGGRRFIIGVKTRNKQTAENSIRPTIFARKARTYA
jgi:Holliday junction resolvase